ncbi:MAG: hypothetical protein Q7T82_10780 [Armatimonadota bacterium]|nr:hypothetical protein [Armatimonadota bacterium]
MANTLKPVAFLPWLELHEEVKVGKVVFWPYEKMKDRNLPTEHPPETLDKYAGAFRTHNDEPAPVTCVSYKTDSPPDERLTRAESREFLRAQHILFAAAYVGAIKQPYLYDFVPTCPSAEHFTLYHFPRKPEDRIKGHFGTDLAVGIIDGFRIKPPDHLHRYAFRLLDPLLLALSRTIMLPQKRSVSVWRTLEWFFYSQTTHGHFTEESRLIMLCMAIDALIPNCKGCQDFVKHVGQTTHSLKLPNRWKRKYKLNHRIITVPCSVLEAWASDFYETRNALVHYTPGENTSVIWRRMRLGRKLSGFPHDILAKYAWFECLWNELDQIGAIPPQPADRTGKPGFAKGRIDRAFRWHMDWQWSLDSMREWWRDFLTGRILPPHWEWNPRPPAE